MSDEKIKNFIETGAEMSGGAIGGAIGFLLGGPAGAIIGGGAGPLITKGAKKILGDLANRHMSHKEIERVGAVAAIALNKIKNKLENGEKLRNDNFFSEDASKRSSAEEIFEGILQKSRNSYEEKKVKFLGNFFANLAFIQNVSIGEANCYLNLIDSLSYRQICTLALLLAKDRLNPPAILRQNNYSNVPGLSYELISLLQEIFSLYTNSIIKCKKKSGNGHVALLSWIDIVPNNLELTFTGKRFSILLGSLEEIEANDFNNIIKLLR
ncbi:MAG: hypothetical protein V1739_07330 [Candidatus Omnitrophota bacterium]